MRSGSIDVGQLTPMLVQSPQTQSPQDSSDPPKVNGSGHKVNGAHADSHLSPGERMAKRRQQGSRGDQREESTSTTVSSTTTVFIDPLNLSLDLIHELTHNQRQYRPDKETGGVNVSILHLPEVVGTSLGRIKAKVPIRCGLAPIVNACVDWGLKGLGQYPAIQRLLWLKAMFNEREEERKSSYEGEARLTRSRSGHSLYGIRGQCLQEITRKFPAGLPESRWRENVYMPMDTYTDLKEVMVSGITGLGLEIQDAVILATMYTLVDVSSSEATSDIIVEEDRLEMKGIIDKFLDHVQVRGEASEFMMRGWGMLEGEKGEAK